MPKCPQCNKPFDEVPRQCPMCKADLDLLVEYVSGLRNGLTRAEQLTRSGRLAEAVWAYLAVLEVDPDNAVAQRQVGQVVSAVRQFDCTSPMRRHVARERGAQLEEENRSRRIWLWAVLTVLLVLTAFAIGYAIGSFLPGPLDNGKPPGKSPFPEEPKRLTG